jgi:small subunit ribosomal protein S9
MEKKKEKGYIEAIGRRKTSTARVRITVASKNKITINDKDAKDYFPTKELSKIVHDVFETSKPEKDFDITVIVKGGGSHSQAEAVRHGIARALVEFDETFKANIKKEGYLKRDPRSKERRKFGLKKARKAPTWSKR